MADVPEYMAAPDTIMEAMGKALPLNSRRLTRVHLQSLAQGLELSFHASSEQLRLMIEGKLREMDKEPRNVQVVCGEKEPYKVWMKDDKGAFFEADLYEEETVSTADHADSEDLAMTDPTTTVEQALAENGTLKETIRRLEGEVAAANEALESETRRVSELEDELERSPSVESVEKLQRELRKEKDKVKSMWRVNCEQLACYDDELAAKDEEIAELKRRIAAMAPDPATRGMGSVATDPAVHDPPSTMPTTDPLPPVRPPASVTPSSSSSSATQPRRWGKAPPVDMFTGDNLELRLEDWLPTLERASTWNNWTPEELLIQFAGHLRGRAFQEWNLMSADDKASYESAIQVLKTRLDPGAKTLAAQDFRHASQRESETVSEFIRRLERTFQIAYGGDNMSPETRDTLLYGQLQEGLRYDIAKGPAVSGAESYRSLCLAAKNEEKRQAELRKRVQYKRDTHQKPSDKKATPSTTVKQPQLTTEDETVPSRNRRWRCYNCGERGHLSRDCKQPRKESSGGSQGRAGLPARAKTIGSQPVKPDDPMNYLHSSPQGSVRQIRVEDRGSARHHARVMVEGVEAKGLVDTGADITIMGGDLFKTVASAARLLKEQFKKPDRTAFTYDNKPFKLDGVMELTISFKSKMISTPVYIKMDAADQLLLSEGLCRQLGVVTYDKDVEMEEAQLKSGGESAKVPIVRVKLVESLRLQPRKSALARVELEDGQSLSGPILFESSQSDDVQLEGSLVHQRDGKSAVVMFTNLTPFTQKLKMGAYVGQASEVGVIEPETRPAPAGPGPEEHCTEVRPMTVSQVKAMSKEKISSRKQKLAGMLKGEGAGLPWQEKSKLHMLLLEYHNIFQLEEDDRGETDMVQMQIDTGDAAPRKQPARRIPFAARQEVARQLRQMQEKGVIKPSISPWASPVVLVRKRDGSLRFCIDYRDLNSVTKADTFPLPRIDDLLDQLGKSKYFSSFDLASGYWQVRVHPDSQEKTAFITHQGLYEFQVMPFGLRNAPAVLQRLMQNVLAGLNPEDAADFVSVYLDDILVFSETLDEHLEHLRAVINRLAAAGLMLKPSKCHFIREEVEYLGYCITQEGLQPTSRHVTAVKDFHVPQNVKEVRQFVGLASYYRRFVPGFSKIAEPIYALTKKGAVFAWTAECQSAFNALKDRLIQAPVLVFPDFTMGFVLETDASIKGLGAVLSQQREDKHLHPVAYASRSLTQAEKGYAITELETLAVVWAISHFHAYLYGNDVTVYTDHSAVKAVLATPSANGKHARWWSKVFGTGVRNVDIVYRSGKLNSNADALSRNPVDPAPAVAIAEGDVQVCNVTATTTLSELLDAEPHPIGDADYFAREQLEDPEVLMLIRYLDTGELPEDSTKARKLVAQAFSFTLLDGILYFVDPRRDDQKRAVVPTQLRGGLLEDSHSGPMAGHFSGVRLYKSLSRHWWWPNMFADCRNHCTACPQCAIVSGSGRVNKPPLHPIPVQRAFQIVGLDVMDLPRTQSGNKHVVVFQDYLTKWPLVFPVPDQKAVRIAQLLSEEVVPMFGVPEALLTDRGTNLLSHLMKDVCSLLGIQKLNTTAYHPQCDGMVERFNRTLKTMLRKHAGKFGVQWDKYLSGVLWAYRNTPHEATGEKPSFLLFGMDCRTPTEAALLPPTPLQLTDVEDYREQLVLSLSSARDLAAKNIQAAQKRYKKQYDKKAKPPDLKVGSWVMVYFPHEETGKARKLSRPWHGPYRVIRVDDPDVTVSKVYFAKDGQIQVHQSRVKSCPRHFPHGFYWYGSRRRGPGRPPKWVSQMLDEQISEGPPLTDEEPAESVEESLAINGEATETDEDSPDPEESPGQVGKPDEQPPGIPDTVSAAAEQNASHHYPLRSRSGRASRKGGK